MNWTTFHGSFHETYLLRQSCSTQELWPPDAHYESVRSNQAIEIVLRAISEDPYHAPWQLLDVLEIQEHPANLSLEDLRELVCDRFRAAAFARCELFRRDRTSERASMRAPRAAAGERKQLPLLGTEVLGFVAVETVDEAGRAVRAVPLEIVSADGALHRIQSDVDGLARVDSLPRGRCLIRLPGLDGSAWRPAEGPSAKQVERGHARTHIVQRGDNLTRIAQQYGFKGWPKLWAAAANAALRKKRTSPHVLQRGDQVQIPPIEICQIERASDQTHRIVILRGRLQVRVRLQDLAGKPISDIRYEHKVRGTRVAQPGSQPTDAQGWMCECISADVEALDISLCEQSVDLTIGLEATPPAQDADTQQPLSRGICERLEGLGYDAGPPSEPLSARARDATTAFARLEMARDAGPGELDADLVRALERAADIDGASAPDAGDQSLLQSVATLSTVRLGALTGPRDAWRFEPLDEGAFVVLRCVTTAAPHVRAAIVGESGQLDALRDPHDESVRTLLYLPAPHRYRVCWTYDRDDYHALLADPSRLEQEGALIDVRQDVRSDQAPLRHELDALEKADPDPDWSGRVREAIGHHLLHRHAFHEGRARPIFDVTPPCVRSLFTVELMRAYVLRASRAAAKDLATISHAIAMMEAAEHGLKDTTLEARAAELLSPDERATFELFREYAWRCAVTRMDKELVIASLENSEALPGGALRAQPASDPDDPDAGVRVAPTAKWIRAAVKIRTDSASQPHGPAVHPRLSTFSSGAAPERFYLRAELRDLVLEYFENYSFAVELRGRRMDLDGTTDPGSGDFLARMKARVEDWEQRTDAVSAYARTLLEQHASAYVFYSTLSSCYPRDIVPFELVERYVEASAFAGAKWWSPLRQHALKDREFWKKLKARTKILAELLKGSGKLCKLLGEHLAAYDLALAEAQQMLETVGRLELTFEGQEVDPARHVLQREHVTVRVDPVGDAGEVTVNIDQTPAAGGSKPRGVKLRFLRSDAAMPSGASAWRPAAVSGTYRVEVPASVERIRQALSFPKPLAVLAESVNLAIAVATLAGEAKVKDKAYAFFDAFKGAWALAESFPGAVLAMAPKQVASPQLKSWESRTKTMRGTSTLLTRADGLLKIYRGIEILVTDEWTEMRYHARQGRILQARLQRFAGVANIVAGLPSALEVTGLALQFGGMANLGGLSTAAMVGFSANPWALALSIGGAIVVAGSALAIDLLQPYNDKLTELERALDQAMDRQISGPRLKASRQVDDLIRAVEAGW